ncbi:hypothetical protein HOF78_00535 [Candidatus Woesearchaeota archaeon]|jgi:hypothetical protein|nr:hypothetical protein [Candidatus Woesearchaeota archaeon]MBT6044547.1 hypothetical protein [Candidatus Woesearchaeota archaeon]
MRGVDRERKMLHEHEIVLFSFMFAFFVIGLFVWGFDANALDYSVEGVSFADGTSLNLVAENGIEKTTDLILTNPLDGDSAIVVLELDYVCEIFSEEVIVDAQTVCETFNYEFLDGSVIYPGESIRVRLMFISENTVSAESIFNVITTGGITTFIVKFDSSVNGVSTDTDLFENPLFELLRDALGLGDGVSAEGLLDPIIYADSTTDLGLTLQPQLFFGSQDVTLLDQKTKTIEFVNLAPEAITIEGIQGSLQGIILSGDLSVVLAEGERIPLDVTCAPTEIMSLNGEVLTLLTDRGNLDLEIYCDGIEGLSNVIDNTAPVVNILEPVASSVSGATNVKVVAYDGGAMYDVAVLKVYFGSKLIKRYTTPAIKGSNVYEFSVDTAGLSLGSDELYATAVDYAGNSGLSEKVTLTIIAPPIAVAADEAVTTDPVTEETIVQEPVIPLVQVNFGSGYTAVTSEDLINAGVADVKIEYHVFGVGDVKFEFKSANLGNVNLDQVKNKNVVKKSISGAEIIDMPQFVIDYFLKTLGADSMIMPMNKPQGYVLGDELIAYYYREDGSSFQIMPDDLISISEDGEMLYLEMKSNSILEGS